MAGIELILYFAIYPREDKRNKVCYYDSSSSGGIKHVGKSETDNKAKN